jgi:hypothetical protein
MGFVRVKGVSHVFLIYLNNRKCHVQNDEQLNAFGGSDKVLIVRNDSLFRTNMEDSGDCGWPNGFYKRRNESEVFRLYGDALPRFKVGTELCHVVNEDQMNKFGGFGQVTEVAPGTDLLRGRSHQGSCLDP